VPVYKKNGALGMVIQADKLIPVNVSPSEHIFIVNSKNPSLLFNNSGDRLPISKVETDNWVQQVLESDMGSNLGVINIGGERYYSAYRNIFSNQFKLLILVSETDIAADLENFSVFIKSAFAIIFVLSVLCSFLIYRIANKPIRKIAEQI